MPRVYVSVGSNIEPARNVASCLKALTACYGELIVSTVYETKPIGFDGDNFYNVAVGFDTDKDVHAIVQDLRAIEHGHGRRRGDARFSSRPLDLDLLLYDDLVLNEPNLQLPRDEITRYAFVLLPLSEIAPDLRHPTEGKTLTELWQSFPNDDQDMKPVEIDRAE